MPIKSYPSNLTSFQYIEDTPSVSHKGQNKTQIEADLIMTEANAKPDYLANNPRKEMSEFLIVKSRIKQFDEIQSKPILNAQSHNRQEVLSRDLGQFNIRYDEKSQGTSQLTSPLFPIKASNYQPIDIDDRQIEEISDEDQKIITEIKQIFETLHNKIQETQRENTHLEELLSKNLFIQYGENRNAHDEQTCLERSLRFLSIFTRKNRASKIQSHDQELDTNDANYRRYCQGLITKNYLAFLCVLNYHDVLTLKISDGEEFNKLTSIALENIDDAKNFFCDYADNNQNYDLRLSSKQVNNFFMVYKKFQEPLKPKPEIIEAYNKITGKFSEQERHQALIDFFKNIKSKNSIYSREDDRFKDKFLELKMIILKAIDNKKNTSLTTNQMCEFCRLYLQFSHNEDFIIKQKISSYYHSLKTPQSNSKVGEIIKKFEPKSNKKAELAIESPDQSQVKEEFKIEENILKKSFLDNLSYKNSRFNSMPVLNQLSMNPSPIPLQICGKKVKGPVRIGDEIYL